MNLLKSLRKVDWTWRGREAPQATDADTTVLSRSGRSDSAGKLICRLDVPVSEDLNDAVAALATVQGLSKAEWVRGIIEDSVWGKLLVLRRLTATAPSGQSDESRTR